MQRTYIAIDLKSFYASVECVARGLDPLKAKLVVADATRTDKTVCLAVSPALKALGVGGRDRLFQVLKKVPRGSFIIAPPRMQKYIEVSSAIFAIYARYIAPEDIHVYSIDEAFLDVTSYLNTYEMSARQLARTIVKDVLGHTGITATVGISENLYLAKVAMDIVAKHLPGDSDGVRIAELDELSYREKLWSHTPLTDFWRIGQGYARRLQDLGIHNMGELARYSLTGYEKLYRVFGVNAELLIDHAWGYEPATISDIKHYHAKNHCLCSGQVLHRAYSKTEAYTIITEMADGLALELTEKHLLTDQIILDIGANLHDSHLHGSFNLSDFTSSSTEIISAFQKLFNRLAPADLQIRKLSLGANHLIKDSENIEKPLRQLGLFANTEKTEQQTEQNLRLQQATLAIQKRYGKNALLKGTNFRPGATTIERNSQIGGHRA
ncbi:DNA methylase [Candidatus Saccharibacteria bacterium]|nr:DNA methylase [Candidatus Saccharibacteria bacterium]